MEPTGSMEGDLPTEKKPEAEKTTVAKLLFGFTGLYERWRNEVEARRYRDPREQDPDYEERLRRLEGGIRDNEPILRIGDHHEGGDKKSWKDYLVVRQEVDEKQIAELRCTVYKICQ
jgi:hypothetical protein